MNTESAALQAHTRPPAIRHWLLQTLPPLLMFGIFFMTRSGSALVFLIGFLLLPVLISLISIVAKLVRYRQRRRYLLRPILTVAVFISIFAIAESTYQAGRTQAIAAGRVIQQQCQLQGACPDTPAGWQKIDSRVRKNDLGNWLHYIAMYQQDGRRFSIRLYRGPDIGDVISGGVDQPFTVEPYLDG